MRWSNRLLAVAVILAVLPVLTGAPAATASSATPTACTPAQVTLSATADRPLYGSGALVHVTVALHNRSSVSCSYETGPFSPNFLLTNSAGVTVWGSCWFGGGPAPCAYYLLLHTLAPGATYRDRLTWDQRTGHPELAVPAGRYTFTVNLPGLSLRAGTSVVLRRPRNVTVTLADSGRHLVLAVGDTLTVRLTASPLVWSAAISSDHRVMTALPEMNPIAGLSVFAARAPGSARVSAVGDPACYPQCLAASRLFFVTVTVRAT